MRKALCVPLAALLSSIAVPADAQTSSKEDFLEKLKCRQGQECDQPVPAEGTHVRRRSFETQPQKRSFSFKPMTESERARLDDSAKKGRLPSADAEVFFDFDRAEITQQARRLLDPMGEALKDASMINYSFVLVGHTDAKGNDGYNLALSDRRAAAVKNYLVERFGIDANRLYSYGRGRQVLKNPADPFAAENRRVQIINRGLVGSR